MAGVVFTSIEQWVAFQEELEEVFERPMDVDLLRGVMDTETLWRSLLPAQKDLMWRGRVMIGYELRLALKVELGVMVEESGILVRQRGKRLGHKGLVGIFSETPMVDLMRRKDRKAAWLRVQDAVNWKLPRLGLPVWAQYVWGMGLLAGMVMMFIWPLWGMLLFFGGTILIYPVEKWAWAFPYPSFGDLLNGAVRMNWPALEMGAGDDERLRLVFAEIMSRHIVPDLNPEEAFPEIVVANPWARSRPQTHVLNGDALRELFFDGQVHEKVVVMRECFAVGPVKLGEGFWAARKEFIHREYDAPPGQYDEWIGNETDKLNGVSPDTEINLWFEDDLFCQVNMWFLIALIRELGLRNSVFRVFPPMGEGWSGFGKVDEVGLLRCFEERVEFTAKDLELGQALWEAYAAGDYGQLRKLAGEGSACFRLLPEVVEAHIERFPEEGLGRPERALQAIRAEGFGSFEELFAEFSRREGIYGFGDLQVKGILKGL